MRNRARHKRSQLGSSKSPFHHPAGSASTKSDVLGFVGDALPLCLRLKSSFEAPVETGKRHKRQGHATHPGYASAVEGPPLRSRTRTHARTHAGSASGNLYNFKFQNKSNLLSVSLDFIHKVLKVAHLE